MLQTYSAIFVQNENSLTLLHEAGYTGTAMISGDSRFDRVAAIVTQFSTLPIIENFIQGRTTIVAGSTWPKDHTLLQEVVQAFPDACFIIAPHHVDAASIQAACKQLPEAVLYADVENGKTGRVLLIDRIGLLTKLYHYADITWIGGGFDKDGVHNVLEAAVYHKPVLFGPVYHKYAEAIELIEAGGAIVVHDSTAIKESLEMLLSNNSERKMIGEKAGNYVASKKGATEKIIHWIQLNRLLTN
jgi:3-deoxy-D-manno-octulosonic-acid transferase